MTAHGRYVYEEVTEAGTRRLVQDAEAVESAAGHHATAELLSRILGIAVRARRREFVQDVGQAAIVLRPRRRLPEGAVLTRQALEQVGYSLGKIVRIQ